MTEFAIFLMVLLLFAVLMSMATYKTITIKKKGGGTRKQRVQVMGDGRYKFVKNTGGTTTTKKSKSKKSGSSGSSTPGTKKRKKPTEVHLVKIIAGLYIANGMTGGAVFNFLDALQTFIIYYMNLWMQGGSKLSTFSPFRNPGYLIVGGKPPIDFPKFKGVVQNTTMVDDIVKSITMALEAYKSANLMQTVTATAFAVGAYALWRKAAIKLKLPRTVDLLLFKVVIR